MTTVVVAPGAEAGPVSATVVDPLELPMFSVALFTLPVVGANVTETVVDELALSVVVPGAPTANWPASVSVIVKGVVNVSDETPLFVIVTGAIVTLPTLVAANVTVAG